MSAQPSTSASALERRILIVDDEPDIRTLLGQVAASHGLETVFAATVPEGLAALQNGPYGICITDITLPGGNGLMVAKQMRALPHYARTPLVIISGNYNSADLQKVKVAFSNCVVMTKPLQLDRIKQIFSAFWPPAAPATPVAPEATPAPSTESPAATAEEAAEPPAAEAAGARRPYRKQEPFPQGGEGAFNLEIDHDELEVRLVSCLRQPHSVRSKGALLEALKENKITHGLDEQVMDEAFSKLPSIRTTGMEFVVARGRHPVHGTPGRIDFKIDVSGQAAYRSGEDEAGETIDYRNAVSIAIVKTGDLLAEVIPPGEGESGLTLSGKPIPAKKGKTPVIRPGEGVKTDPKERFYYSACQGRPVFSHAVLSVSSVYEVGSDVDFSTGHIRFAGHVIIHGNVQDDFEVECKSAEIHGIIGACRIVCEDYLEAPGGVSGRDKAEIIVGGNAEIKYVNQASLTIQGNLRVSRDMVNSRVWCLGKVHAGKIVGGTCVALQGVEAKVLGSDLGVNTLVQPGINYKLLAAEEELVQMDEEIFNLLKPVSTLFGDRAKFKSLPPEKQAEYRALFGKFLELKGKHDELSGRRKKLANDTEMTPVKEVVVWTTLYPDVVIRTATCMRHIKTEFTGPLAMIEDMERGTLRPASYVPGKGIVADENKDAAPPA